MPLRSVQNQRVGRLLRHQTDRQLRERGVVDLVIGQKAANAAIIGALLNPCFEQYSDPTQIHGGQSQRTQPKADHQLQPRAVSAERLVENVCEGGDV